MKNLALFASVLALLSTSTVARPAPSPSASASPLTPPDPTAGPFPGGGAWLESRAHARAARRCTDPSVGLVARTDGSTLPSDLVALGSLSALRASARPPKGEDSGQTTTIERFASEPLTLVSVDAPRLCLTAPDVAPSSPEKNREEGVDVAVTACNVPGASSGSATVFSVEDAPKRASAAVAPSPSSSPLSSSSVAGSSPALVFRTLPRRSIQNAPVSPASGAHSGVPPSAGPLVDLGAASAKAPAAATDEDETVPASRCLVASGGRARLARCPAASSPDFAASTWRVAPANVTVTSLVTGGSDDGAAAAPRYVWKTTTGFLLVSQASGDCVSSSGEIAACDPKAEGMLFKLCSGPGKCAEFAKPEC